MSTERFRPLHAHALALVERLHARYAVDRTGTFAPPPGLLSPFEHAHAPVTLTPRSGSAAPLSAAFTTFPGLLLHVGRWHVASFPACGCDACDERADDEARRLDELVDHVVAGRFTEELRLPFVGPARLLVGFGPGTSGWTTIPRPVARALAKRDPRRIGWQAWPLRDGTR